ncbi:hypothetical protein [Mesomycoplasma hyorhinis]|uniref:hypothetical protein n=1 Tax=Mesomycoplasma hyorhinis TaxID=2100 RepID=UPI001C03DC0F|nr:hypothetical protein [Mesomycoplasma hyorhinis]
MFNQFNIETTHVQWNDNNEKVFLKIISLEKWRKNKHGNSDEVDKNKIFCYHILNDAIKYYFSESSENRRDGTYNSWDFTTNKAKWLGNYVILTKERKIYIGKGKFIERIKDHIKNKPWGNIIQEVFILTLDQTKGTHNEKWFEFVEKILISKFTKDEKYNKKEGNKTNLVDEVQNGLEDFVKQSELMFKTFNLYPFKSKNNNEIKVINSKNEEIPIKSDNLQTQAATIHNKINNITNNNREENREYKLENKNNKIIKFPPPSGIKRYSVAQFLDNHTDLYLTFTYPDSDKQIFLLVHDYNNITIEKGSYIWSVNNNPKTKKQSTINFRTEFNIPLEQTQLTENIKINGRSFVTVLKYLTCYAYFWENTFYTHTKNTDGKLLYDLLKDDSNKNNKPYSLIQVPKNTDIGIKKWIFEFFKLNQGITLTYGSEYPIEIFIKEFKSNDDNIIIVKKGSYIKRPNGFVRNDKGWLRAKEDVFKAAKILEKYQINSEKTQELQEDIEIINCSVNKILSAFSGKKPGNDELKIKNDNKTLRDYFNAIKK